ncbi:hypothetical protein D3C78_1755570 [compost metagenome]
MVETGAELVVLAASTEGEGVNPRPKRTAILRISINLLLIHFIGWLSLLSILIDSNALQDARKWYES